MGNEGSMDRREFLTRAVVGSVATAVAATSVASSSFKPLIAEAAEGQEHDEFPYPVDPAYERFDARYTWYQQGFENDGSTDVPASDLFVKKDVSEEAGRKDTGKDLPLIIGEEILGKPDHVATVHEVGVAFFSAGAAYPYLRAEEPGWTKLDAALYTAGMSVEKNFNGFTMPAAGPGGLITSYPVDRDTNEVGDEPVTIAGMYNWDNSSAEKAIAEGSQWQFESPEEATRMVKKAARFLGADLVGIAPYDERWTYKTWSRPNVGVMQPPHGKKSLVPFNAMAFAQERKAVTYGLTEFPADWEKYAGFTPKYVVTMAIEMDYEAVKTAPSLIAGAAAGKVYSNMGEVTYKVATFLRELGYHAIPSGNDTGINPPIAVQAGLGELSRMGMLITQKYGPRIRLCKVYTDLELVADKPRSFGVREFCKHCMKCADACPSQAISHAKEPFMVQPEDCNISMNPYTEKWPVDPYRCGAYFAYCGHDCGNCVAVCSWNKIESWNHDIARIATQIPVIQDVARKFDEWFGYGGPTSPEERLDSGYVSNMVTDFWKDTEPTPVR